MNLFDAVSRDDFRKLLGASLYARSGLSSEWHNLDKVDKQLALELINKIDELLVAIGECDIYYR